MGYTPILIRRQNIYIHKTKHMQGGQKQRISLARAAYSRAHVCLLDDPLSALDAAVRAHGWQECVCGVMRGATRIVIGTDAAHLAGCHKVCMLSLWHL